MAENEEGFVSVVGAALIQPIFDLVEKLESMKPVLPNEVKTGQHENGYSNSKSFSLKRSKTIRLFP